MLKRGPFSSITSRIPLWAQLTAGLLIVGFVFYAAMSTNPYVSAWDEENSNFYETAMQALRISNINPTAPTALIFWSKDLEDSIPAVRAFNQSPSSLRVYGVHLTSDETMEVRTLWLKFAPRPATLLIDREQLLQTAFHARAFPMVYIILPKQKKIYSYLGNINDSRQRMLEIIASESAP